MLESGDRVHPSFDGVVDRKRKMYREIIILGIRAQSTPHMMITGLQPYYIVDLDHNISEAHCNQFHRIVFATECTDYRS